MKAAAAAERRLIEYQDIIYNRVPHAGDIRRALPALVVPAAVLAAWLLAQILTGRTPVLAAGAVAQPDDATDTGFPSRARHRHRMVLIFSAFGKRTRGFDDLA